MELLSLPEKNFFYHYSNIDTTNSYYNTGLKKSQLLNICKAVHSAFILSDDDSKYQFDIEFSNNSYREYHWATESPWFISPVIKRYNSDGEYEIYFAKADFEGGVGYRFILTYQNGVFLIKSVSRDPQDHFGCWYDEDYISSFCSSN